MSDRIRHLKLSHVVLPLGQPGQRRQGADRPAEAADRDGAAVRRGRHRAGPRGMGFSYSKRAGGPAQYAHLAEIAEVAIGAGPLRHRPHLPVAAVGGRIGRPLGCRHPGDRGARRRTVGPQGPPRRPAAGEAASAPTAIRAASTTPPAASCRHRSTRSRRRPPRRWRPASVASRSRWGSRTGRPIWTGWRQCASTSARRR